MKINFHFQDRVDVRCWLEGAHKWFVMKRAFFFSFSFKGYALKIWGYVTMQNKTWNWIRGSLSASNCLQSDWSCVLDGHKSSAGSRWPEKIIHIHSRKKIMNYLCKKKGNPEKHSNVIQTDILRRFLSRPRQKNFTFTLSFSPANEQHLMSIYWLSWIEMIF